MKHSKCFPNHIQTRVATNDPNVLEAAFRRFDRPPEGARSDHLQLVPFAGTPYLLANLILART
ncbi:hypothetical protein D3C81_559620 [compost metagenome]|jgi:hypothetical protein